MIKQPILLMLFAVTVAGAQTPVEQVAAAENNFARMSKEQNTRDAFVNFLADSAIVFAQGNPVPGKVQWQKLKPNTAGLLFWWPTVSDVAASGDFGYNTGPFESGKRGAEPATYGYFSSVWEKQDGEWKVVIDMGMVLPGPEATKSVWKANKPMTRVKGKAKRTRALPDFVAFNKSYDEKLNKEGRSYLENYLDSEARLHRTGHFPATTREAIRAFTDSREKYVFEHLGGDVASSEDLAYAYGRVKAYEKNAGKEVTLNYLRIFRKEDGKNWKVVLDVIGG